MGELLALAFTEQALLEAWEQMREAVLVGGEAGLEVGAVPSLVDRIVEPALLRPRKSQTGTGL